MTVYKFNISKLFTKITLGLFLVLSFSISPTVFAQEYKVIKKNEHFKKNDSINSINFKETLKDKKEQIVIDSTKQVKDTLEKSTLTSQLFHYAEDYTELNETKKFIKLYNKAHIKYKDIDITA